jgi:multiple sugar transport system ATP-binding protein
VAQAVPALREGAQGVLVLGVRPEHVRLSDAAPYRARVEAAEYLGTTQIVTLSAAHGTVKARVPAAAAVQPGAVTGIEFAAPTLSLFDGASGRALVTAANERVLRG